MSITFTQEWLLRFLDGREQHGLITKGIDIQEATTNVSRDEILALVHDGFIKIESTNNIPSMQGPSGSAIFHLTAKGRDFFRPREV